MRSASLAVCAGDMYGTESPVRVSEKIIESYGPVKSRFISCRTYTREHRVKEKYHTQLDYYARALEQLLEKKVKEKIIYSFTLQEEIKI